MVRTKEEGKKKKGGIGGSPLPSLSLSLSLHCQFPHHSLRFSCSSCPPPLSLSLSLSSNANNAINSIIMIYHPSLPFTLTHLNTLNTATTPSLSLSLSLYTTQIPSSPSSRSPFHSIHIHSPQFSNILRYTLNLGLQQ